MKKILLIAVIFATNAMAQDSTTTTTAPAASTAKVTSAETTSQTDKSFYQILKDSPLSLMVLSEQTFSDSKNKKGDFVNRWTNDTEFYLSYKITKFDSVRFNTGIVNSTTSVDTNEASWAGATVRYKRGKILTEKEHGVDMSAETRLSFYDKETKDKAALFGSTSLRANFGRSITPKLYVGSTLRWDQNIRTSGTKKKLTKTYLAAYLTPSYKITKDLSASLGMAFKQYLQTNNKEKNKFNLVPEVSYSINKQISVAAYWDTTPMKSNDDSFFAKNFASKSSVGAYVVFDVF